MSLSNLILLFGMPRSGTTWIGKIFDSHPDTLYLHEPDSVRYIKDVSRMPAEPCWEDHREFVENYVNRILEIRSPRVVGKRPIFPKSYLSRSGNAFARYASPLVSGLSRYFKSATIPTLSKLKPEEFAVVWKSVESAARIGVICNAIDVAKPILIVRHPCGQIASTLRGKKFMSSVPASEKFGFFREAEQAGFAKKYDVTIERLKTLTPVERLAWKWVLINEKALNEVRQFDGKLCVYEKVVSDPELLRGFFDYTKLTWHSQVGQFLRNSTTKGSDDYFSVYRSNSHDTDAWRNDLNEDDIAKVMSVVEGTQAWSAYQAAIDSDQ